MRKQKKIKICVILGTRPEIIKMFPVIKECEKERINFFIIHTGQHYSYSMDRIFFKELKLSHPKYDLGVGSGSHGSQTGLMLSKIEEILIKEKPDIVLVQGDTNSVLSGALAATKLNIPIGHIEAGLRSGFRDMPEEINRIIVDHISDFLFVPTREAKKNLIKEGIPNKKIFVTGNTIVDSVLSCISLARKKSRILKKIGVKEYNYLLFTIHRSETVDNKSNLREILYGLKLLSEFIQMPIIWPIHPRTKARIDAFNLFSFILSIKNLVIIDPVGFLDFLMLESGARLILTDSGGVQEEGCILKTPCITLRNNTERPESVSVGANIVTGIDAQKIFIGSKKMLKRKRNWKNPFGDGRGAQKIISALKGL